jgi:hypothetical protein
VLVAVLTWHPPVVCLTGRCLLQVLGAGQVGRHVRRISFEPASEEETTHYRQRRLARTLCARVGSAPDRQDPARLQFTCLGGEGRVVRVMGPDDRLGWTRRLCSGLTVQRIHSARFCIVDGAVARRLAVRASLPVQDGRERVRSSPESARRKQGDRA